MAMYFVGAWTTTRLRARHFVSRGAALALVLVAACDPAPDRGVGPNDPPVCAPGVTISMSNDPSPVFSWTPECRTAALSVRGSAHLWAVVAGTNSMTGPVTYGVTPAGAMGLGFADPFEPGVEYTVMLERVASGVTFDTVATLTFTPPAPGVSAVRVPRVP